MGSDYEFKPTILLISRSQLPRGLRHRSAAACLLKLWVWIPQGAWMFVCCECCVLSGRGLCGELITRPEESYRMWCVIVCDLETSRMRRPWPALGRSATGKKKLLIKKKKPLDREWIRIMPPRSKDSTHSSHYLTLRWLMSYIYGAPILDVSRSHTTTQHSR